MCGCRSFDDSTWGAFDTNDDVDSVWGFNPAKVSGDFQFSLNIVVAYTEHGLVVHI